MLAHVQTDSEPKIERKKSQYSQVGMHQRLIIIIFIMSVNIDELIDQG